MPLFQVKVFQQISSPKFCTDSPDQYKIEYLVSLKMEALSSIAIAMTAPSLTHTAIDSDKINNGCNQSRCYVSCQVAGPWTVPETRFNSAILSEVNRAALVA